MSTTRCPIDLTVLILTYNEARHIERSIASVKSFARDIIVVDSYSTDATAELAQGAGARVLFNPFVNYSKQFQWGLDNAGIDTEWVLRLDADEIIEEDLGANLIKVIQSAPADVVGLNMDRKHIFMGSWIRHGGRYPLRLLRVWRRNNGRIEDRWMDEHIVTWGGRTIDLKGGFSDCNLNDLTFFTEKHNKYATREAIDRLIQKYDLISMDDAIYKEPPSAQAKLKRFIKEKIYNRLPFWAAPLFYFIFRDFIQLGFLDGKAGLVYHFLQGFWYRFLVGAKTWELEQGLQNLPDKAARIAYLEDKTGHSLLYS
jgi:glycosyltransferase involved in cell wall biosynthesis